MINQDEDFDWDPNYRLGVGMMLVNQKNQVFLGQRRDNKDDAWQMPQGGITLHEDPDHAMLRELVEEIGTRNVEIIVKSKSWYKYNLPDELANRLWRGRYKGQQQLWYALRFRGKDHEININTYHPEFSKWQWFEKYQVLDLIVPFKRSLYRQVFEDLWPFVEKHPKD
ncbi:RNA pyrophosphohydrolase [Candidatus Bealeia paramacronuclearis]|uniref:RNA pyrophosphohydrolase n=1 Tax=Candidatus Bealeia paramacronuclearis TaxID=1921001 RepID=A0ABZ2C0G0_9PROT|nr:RNA pyrophosphohydrolase [Candidatus Bealeia paramacronuclearis]